MSSVAKHYDVIVIGSGGGMKLYKPATQLGLRTALCEKGPFGGTCLNRGCIPSKMLIHAAEIAEEVRDSNKLFFTPQELEHDFAALVDDTCAAVDGDARSISVNVAKNTFLDHYSEPARFVGPKRLKCGDVEITGDRIFIAAGSRPHIPEQFVGLPVMTSTEALRLRKKPKSLIVIGGGYIACELAFYFGGLGVPIQVVVRSRLLRAEDRETADEFARVFSERFPVLKVDSIVSASHDADTGFSVVVNTESGQRVLQAEHVLVATGVVPNTDLLDVEKAGIQTREGGFIKVDEFLRTTAEGVWALGDIAGNFLFRHSVNYEGEYLNETALTCATPPYPIDYTGMPHAVFSYPTVAGVGETEEQLQARGCSYVKGVNPYKSSAMGMALRADSGFAKLLIERGTRRILGCHIVGKEAATLIHEIIPMLRKQGTLDDILYSVHIHPAMSEIVRNAARKARDALVEAGDDLPFLLRLK